ncbi:hypothetical protein BJ170DRAFT_364547 [Xylariales sp. AK1849]|nr:hypothetical protein BJ170DRAFT_364547 [Xylariales sp. AK1849]
MVSYKLVAHIHSEWIANFNAKGMKFCFATCVESGGSPQFNVVSYADTVSNNVSVTWEEAYAIAASKTIFADQATFDIATTPQDIEFGQTYEVDSSWTTLPPNPDAKAPKAGFRFRNKTKSSAVVYKIVNGSRKAAYFSSAGPLPPGTEDLTPKAKCRVWFSSNHDTESMISDFNGDEKSVDLTGKTSAEVWFTADGLWANAQPSNWS